MLKCDFNIKLQSNFIEIAIQHWCSFAAKFAALFQTTFSEEHVLETAAVNK